LHLREAYLKNKKNNKLFFINTLWETIPNFDNESKSVNLSQSFSDDNSFISDIKSKT
jgi:hypothetical protein